MVQQAAFPHLPRPNARGKEKMTDNGMKRHTINAWMEDKTGVWNRVAGLFRGRNFNVESLGGGQSETTYSPYRSGKASLRRTSAIDASSTG